MLSAIPPSAPTSSALIGVVLIGSTWLIISRLDILRSERKIDSLGSREAVFLINNLLLVALAAIVFWGTFFPLISELLTGTHSTLAAPWFDRFTTPLAVLLVLFTGVGPLLAWRRISWQGAKRVFTIPLIAAATAGRAGSDFHRCRPRASVGAGDLLPGRLHRDRPVPGDLAGCGSRAPSGRRFDAPGAIWAIAIRNRHRYGGYIVHLGIVILLVGIAASSSFETKQDIELTPGESTVVNDYR